MMLGEMDFVGTYVQPYYYNELPLPISSFSLLCELIQQQSIAHCTTIQTQFWWIRRPLHDFDADFIDEFAYRFGGRRHWIGTKECPIEAIGHASGPAYGTWTQIAPDLARTCRQNGIDWISE